MNSNEEGKNMLIREVQLADAELLQRLISGVESSSDYMLFESGERTISVEQLKARISSIETDSQSEIFMAEMDSELLGYLMAIGGNSEERCIRSIWLLAFPLIVEEKESEPNCLNTLRNGRMNIKFIEWN